MLYKWFLVLFLFVHQITHLWFKIDYQNQGGKYYLYLTRQGFSLLFIALFLDACLVLSRYFEERKNKIESENLCHFQKNHFKLKLSMILTNTTYTLAFVITLLYWIFVFSTTDPKGTADAYLNVVVYLFQVIWSLVFLIAQFSKIRKNVQFQKCKKALFEFSKMAKNQFLHQKKV